ncbi:MAG: class I SAM-dependent methyltransferase [Planctomycetota bacterium]|jgi:ubiquinone/menaquinone biosynthesis C-methylase UbiE
MEELKFSPSFKLMKFAFKIRDFISPRIYVLEEVGIEPGNTVLDFGCGPGSYIVPLSSLVGRPGEIFAQDLNPLAIKSVQDIVSKNKLENVKTIHSNCDTGLPDQSVDVVLLYDTYHDLNNPDNVLQELTRILKTEGILSFSDHHMKDKEIRENFLSNKLFRFIKKNKKTYTFSKNT